MRLEHLNDHGPTPEGFTLSAEFGQNGQAITRRAKTRGQQPRTGFGSFVHLQRQPRTADHRGVLSIRAARRYRWRLAGGRLIAGGARVALRA